MSDTAVKEDTMTEDTVVIIGQNYWGKGSTLAEAKKAWQRWGRKLSDGYTVLTFGDGSRFVGVDQMGRVFWEGEEPTEREVKARGGRK